MLGASLLRAGVHRRAAGLVMASLVIAGGGAAGCLTRPVEPLAPNTTVTILEEVGQSSVDKIDLLLVVDNSASMADKQEILALTIPDLIAGLLNPGCVDATGALVGTPPMTATDPCPPGLTREFKAVTDVHVGLLSSSLGTYGAAGCPTSGMYGNPTKDDEGHLITRTNGTAAPPRTYPGQQFLVWDPTMTLTPPGESNLGDPFTPTPGLETSLHDMVIGDGQTGCGFESQNESWYRFLVEPTPYPIKDNAGPTTTNGLDTDLLDQRKAFLRPDSLLAIVNVTDETDTSIRPDHGLQIIANQGPLPIPRAECNDPTKGPLDPCCASCGESTPKGCPADLACTSGSPTGKIAATSGSQGELALRAFGLSTGFVSHKARYGVEFFYQPSRYVNALTGAKVTGLDGKSHDNPIYSNLDPDHYTGLVRTPSLVFYATITGVPWQLIARQKDGQPNLVGGVNPADASQIGGFKTAKELGVVDAQNHTAWDYLVGDPEHYVPPLSPFMQESTTPRSGTDGLTGTVLSSDTTATNTINGNERVIGSAAAPPGDIEYACTFPLLSPHDCTDPQYAAGCDCTADTPAGHPLCAPNPHDVNPQSLKNTLQIAAKAYPGIKNLAIARGLGDQGIVASICPAQLNVNTDGTPQLNTDGTPAPDFGYRPAVRAIIDRLKTVIGKQCLPRTLVLDTNGQANCLVIEARDPKGGACSCAGPARKGVDMANQPAVAEAQEEHPELAKDCFCEVVQVQGAALTSCQNDLVSSNADGWCYVDEDHGNKALVQGCPATEQHEVRFVGDGVPTDAVDFILCNGT